MHDFPSDYSGDHSLQVFTDTAITDPAKLAELSKRSRRPRKWPRWVKWAAGAGALTVALLIGVVLGHFVI